MSVLYKSTGWLPAFKITPLFSSEECSAFIKMAEDSGKFKEAKTLTPEGNIEVNPEFRRSLISFWNPQSELYKQIAARVLENLDLINEHYNFDLDTDPATLLPYIHILRYDSQNRGMLEMHADTGGYDRIDRRKLSISILLNSQDDYTGGRLTVFNGLKTNAQIDCEVGSAVVFPSFQYHEVPPIETGVRYVAVMWLMGPRFK